LDFCITPTSKIFSEFGDFGCYKKALLLIVQERAFLETKEYPKILGILGSVV